MKWNLAQGFLLEGAGRGERCRVRGGGGGGGGYANVWDHLCATSHTATAAAAAVTIIPPKTFLAFVREADSRARKVGKKQNRQTGRKKNANKNTKLFVLQKQESRGRF